MISKLNWFASDQFVPESKIGSSERIAWVSKWNTPLIKGNFPFYIDVNFTWVACFDGRNLQKLHVMAVNCMMGTQMGNLISNSKLIEQAFVFRINLFASIA